jgi:hypothetical protein
MPNAMDIGFSFPTCINILAERGPAEWKEEAVTKVQNILDRKRVEAITISRQTRSKMPATGLGAHCGAGRNKTVRHSPADDAPPVQLHAPLLHAPSADVSGRATRLVRTPHRNRR